MTALYNELEPYPAQWLRNLIAAGHIAAGTVDDRSIVELQPEDVRGATQAHFFAGIGVWSAALRLAGWPDDRSVWTGSCPCQPFSAAGRGRGFDDDRHLWPEWFRLIRQCRPATILGEQVASPAGLEWLDAVFADLEGAGYACAAADTCAAGVGAPHIRQRLYFVAHADVQPRDVHAPGRQPGRGVPDAAGRGATGELADVPEVGRRQGHKERSRRGGREVAHEERDRSSDDRKARQLGNAGSARGRRNTGAISRAQVEVQDEWLEHRRLVDVPRDAGATRGFWADAEWLLCRDGKVRAVVPGAFPLAHGAPARVGRLRAYGNAIVRQQAAAFIGAVMDMIGGAA